MVSAKPKTIQEKTENKQRGCRYCEKNHWSDECTEYMTLEERKRKIRGCCYRCLKHGHMAYDCKANVCTVAYIINTTEVCVLRNSNLSRKLRQRLLLYP